MMEEEKKMESEFKIGDVIVEIGEVDRLVVTNISLRFYWTLRCTYDKHEMSMRSEGGIAMPIEIVDQEFVKVGVWDYKRNEEVDDD